MDEDDDPFDYDQIDSIVSAHQQSKAAAQSSLGVPPNSPPAVPVGRQWPGSDGGFGGPGRASGSAAQPLHANGAPRPLGKPAAAPWPPEQPPARSWGQQNTAARPPQQPSAPWRPGGQSGSWSASQQAPSAPGSNHATPTPTPPSNVSSQVHHSGPKPPQGVPQQPAVGYRGAPPVQRAGAQHSEAPSRPLAGPQGLPAPLPPISAQPGVRQPLSLHPHHINANAAGPQHGAGHAQHSHAPLQQSCSPPAAHRTAATAPPPHPIPQQPIPYPQQGPPMGAIQPHTGVKILPSAVPAPAMGGHSMNHMQTDGGAGVPHWQGGGQGMRQGAGGYPTQHQGGLTAMQQPDHSGLMQQLHALQKQLEDKQRREEFLKAELAEQTRLATDTERRRRDAEERAALLKRERDMEKAQREMAQAELRSEQERSMKQRLSPNRRSTPRSGLDAAQPSQRHHYPPSQPDPHDLPDTSTSPQPLPHDMQPAARPEPHQQPPAAPSQPQPAEARASQPQPPQPAAAAAAQLPADAAQVASDLAALRVETLAGGAGVLAVAVERLACGSDTAPWQALWRHAPQSVQLLLQAGAPTDILQPSQRQRAGQGTRPCGEATQLLAATRRAVHCLAAHDNKTQSPLPMLSTVPHLQVVTTPQRAVSSAVDAAAALAALLRHAALVSCGGSHGGMGGPGSVGNVGSRQGTLQSSLTSNHTTPPDPAVFAVTVSAVSTSTTDEPRCVCPTCLPYLPAALHVLAVLVHHAIPAAHSPATHTDASAAADGDANTGMEGIEGAAGEGGARQGSAGRLSDKLARRSRLLSTAVSHTEGVSTGRDLQGLLEITLEACVALLQAPQVCQREWLQLRVGQVLSGLAMHWPHGTAADMEVAGQPAAPSPHPLTIAWHYRIAQDALPDGSGGPSQTLIESLLTSQHAPMQAAGVQLMRVLLQRADVGVRTIAVALQRQPTQPMDVGGDGPQPQDDNMGGSLAMHATNSKRPLEAGDVRTLLAALLDGLQCAATALTTLPDPHTTTATATRMQATATGILHHPHTYPAHSQDGATAAAAATALRPLSLSVAGGLPAGLPWPASAGSLVCDSVGGVGCDCVGVVRGYLHVLALLYDGGGVCEGECVEGVCHEALGRRVPGVAQQLLGIADGAVRASWAGCQGLQHDTLQQNPSAAATAHSSPSATPATSQPQRASAHTDSQGTSEGLAQHVRVALEALLLLYEVLSTPSPQLGAMLMEELIVDVSAQHSFYAATARLVDWRAAMLATVPDLRSAQGLALAQWTRRCAVACSLAGEGALPGGATAAGGLLSAMQSVRSLAALLLRQADAAVQRHQPAGEDGTAMVLDA